MKRLLSLALMLAWVQINAQSLQSVSKKGEKESNHDWHNLDYETDKIYGTSSNRAFEELLKDKKPKKKVVVAVIDSGVETDHEDLNYCIWTNADEIPDNGKDDDNNGYIDDVHGWNFLVTDSGTDIHQENLEATRILRIEKETKYSTLGRPEWLTDEMLETAQEIYDENEAQLKGFEQLARAYLVIDSVMTAETGNEEWTFEEALAVKSEEERVQSIQKVLKRFKLFGISKGDLKEIQEQKTNFEAYYLNMSFKARTELKPGDTGYGNNHYEGPAADHGTHVAGLIAADRNNNLGARGIASGSVEIMTIRAVPDGDERDIDVANAIRYAVDNGASIINMSFGKGLSPFKNEVDKAVEYAASKNVLLVHAAGNDSENNDEVGNFPNPKLTSGTVAENFVTVGASSISKKKDLPASFSNYGSMEVDIFAPGHEVYSTMPDNGYKNQSGTSMAAPVFSGVAALVWSYYPDLTAVELKNLLLESATDVSKKKVLKPGTKDKVRFSELSKTGGIVNAYNALKLAESRSM
ncbi:MAG: S8 family serine peptidase [Flavobacteriales bacterium]